MAATARGERIMMEKARKLADTVEDPIEKLRQQCLSRGASGIKGLGRAFRNMDDDGNRRLDFNEFKKGLDDYGVHLDEEDEYKDAFDRFDLNHDGALDFEEFLKCLRPKMSKHRVRLVRQAFNKVDKNSDGRLTVEDLRGVYNVTHHKKYVSGEKTEDDILREFLDSFDTPGDADGVVTWEEFLNYYVGVSVSIDTDAYFDLMMRQAWKL